MMEKEKYMQIGTLRQKRRAKLQVSAIHQTLDGGAEFRAAEGPVAARVHDLQ